MIERRMFLLAATGALLLPDRSRADVVFENATFRVMRKGDDIGRHQIRFEPDGDLVKVTTAIDIKVKLAFITVASFKQDAVERWQGGTLVEGRSRIVDDGDIFDVSFEAKDEQLVVQGPKGRVRVPLGTMTDIAFWNQEIVHETTLLDSKTTELIKTTTTPGVPDMVDLGDGRKVAATRYEMSGTQGRTGSIWYDESGRFVRTSFVTRGERLDYYPIG
ncbi:DUF6134 family protein [Geminicoccus harenae]|uniref:DUF6134 family protein n=1 Tax=Geminicoccus harenae TaxID=2498453 RepID=UPI00168A7C1C|nr:DUF6134 family protein [Geminicoccus harenae]